MSDQSSSPFPSSFATSSKSTGTSPPSKTPQTTPLSLAKKVSPLQASPSSTTGYVTASSSKTPSPAKDKRQRATAQSGNNAPYKYQQRQDLYNREDDELEDYSSTEKWNQITLPQKKKFLNNKLTEGMTLTSKGGTTYTKSNPIKPNTHTGTVNALFDDYLRYKSGNTKDRKFVEDLGGNGLCPRIRGKGLSKREKIQHRIEGEYEKPKPYKQLGRYLINRDKLADDIVMLKRVGGSKVPEFLSQRVSHSVAKALASVLRQSIPECESMSSAEIKMLQTILKLCRYSNITISNPHEKTDEEKEMDRFDILSGEIQAGNDNKALVKEFKLMVVKFMNAGRIPRRQAQEILVDIASMGL